MKIERLNENQIRCTLSKEDLESRNIKVSELVYGTEKAKSLFRELMRSAFNKFGFETEDIPLMVEAVPISSDSIILIVTKVDYPDEFDVRYSTFSDDDDDSDDDEDYDDYNILSDDEDIPIPEPSVGAANDILKMMHQVADGAMDSKDDSSSEEFEVPEQLTRIYQFATLYDVMEAASMLSSAALGRNDLYRTPENNYLLIISMDKTSPNVFNKVCNILSEYGSLREIYCGSDSYIREHYKMVSSGSALSQLAAI